MAAEEGTERGSLKKGELTQADWEEKDRADDIGAGH